MPRIAPPGAMAMAEELNDGIKETIRKAHRTLDAAAAAQILKGLGIGSETSSPKELGEVISAAASSLKSTGELQTSLMKQLTDQILNGSKDGDIKAVVDRILLIKLVESMGKSQTQEVSPDVKMLMELYKETIKELKEELRERKQSQQPSLIEEQLQALILQLLSQHMAKAADPIANLKEFLRLREEAKDLFTDSSSVPPEYSEGALRLRALEKEEKALAVEENKFLSQLNYKERMISQQIPALIQQAGAVLANVLGAYGLTPVRPLQFDGEASMEAEKLAKEGS
jgi:hypothetical protein